jgi:hypothetical protein
VTRLCPKPATVKRLCNFYNIEINVNYQHVTDSSVVSALKTKEKKLHFRETFFPLDVVAEDIADGISYFPAKEQQLHSESGLELSFFDPISAITNPLSRTAQASGHA